MGNPQTNALSKGSKHLNNHLSGRFAGNGDVNSVQDNQHGSTLYSDVNTTTQNNNFLNNSQSDTLPSLRNSKFVKQDVIVSDTNINIDNKSSSNNYMDDPRVKANLTARKDANQLIDMKTLMVLALIVMFFIFILPFLYDALN